MVDWEELDKADKSQHVDVKPVPHKEVRVIKSDDDPFIYPLKKKILNQPGSPKYEMSIPKPLIQTSDSSGEVVNQDVNHDGIEDPEDQDYLESQREKQPEEQQTQDGSQWQDKSAQQDDYFVVTPNALFRAHNIPRAKACVPIEHDDDNPSSFPIPLKYINVIHTTQGRLDSAAPPQIHDVRPHDLDQVLYEEPWTGSTVFIIIRPQSKLCRTFKNGDTWRVQKTDRPKWIMSSDWSKYRGNRNEWKAE